MILPTRRRSNTPPSSGACGSRVKRTIFIASNPVSHALYKSASPCKHCRNETRKETPVHYAKPPVGMLPNDRIAYSPIVNRKPLKLPNKARMVVWTVTNVEEWDPTQTMPRTVLTPPAGGSPMPDIPNWCWHEYGNRVGFWRLLQVYDDFKIPGVMNV